MVVVAGAGHPGGEQSKYGCPSYDAVHDASVAARNVPRYIRSDVSEGQPLGAWVVELRSGRSDSAWDLFLDRHRRLIFAAIRHYAQDYDDVMDVFARVCEALRADDLTKIRSYLDQPTHRARFSTWLVAVVRNLTVDWFRHRDGRRRLSAVASTLPPLQRCIFESVFLHRRSHIEAYELLKSGEGLRLTFGQFLVEVSATYRAVNAGRRGGVLRALAGPVPPPVEAQDLGNVVAEQREELEAALRVLDPVDRVAVELYVVEEMSAAAVAKVVGWPSAKAVYNRVYRALATLRERLTSSAPHVPLSSLAPSGRPMSREI